MWKRLGIAIAVGTLFAASLGGAAVATTDVAPPTNPPPGVEDTFGEEDWQLSQEEIADFNVETDALVAYLTELGYDVTIQTGDDGVRYPIYEEDNEQIFEAVNAFYEQMFTDEVAAWSDDEKAAWNADIDAFIADLAAQGVEIAPGVYDVDWTEELDAALMEADGFFGGDDADWEFNDEDIAQMNAETDALVEHLKDLGFDVKVETDDAGFRYPNLGEEDEEMMAAIDAFYEARFAADVESWSDAEKAEWNADIDAMIADLDSQGITATKVEIAPGVYDIDWTDELDAALGENDGGFFDDDLGGEPSAQDVAEMNAETDALVEHLTGLGFDVQVETDEYGIRQPTLDDDPDSAVYEAINDYYQAMFTDEVAAWSDEEKAEWNASIDEMVAELEAEGATPEKVEIAPGVFDIDWTDELDGGFMDGPFNDLDFPEIGELLQEDAA